MNIWAPGRVNLIGEHTDYSGGLVLPAAIQLGLSFDVKERGDGMVDLVSTTFGAGISFSADGGGPQVHGWTRFGQAVAAELAVIGRPPVGMTGRISSTLPPGSGLSSSAALEVGLALALCAVADFKVPSLELAAACQQAELRAVGVPCGILDQAACLLGARDAALLLNCATLEHKLISIPEDAAFFILDSGVSRQLEHSGYAQRRSELESALAVIGASTSMGLTEDDLADLDDLHRRRLRHVVTENDRVLAFTVALANDDLPTAGAILNESHASLRDDYEVSIPELDDLVACARQCGAYGARLLGGGFGGAALALVDIELLSEVSQAIAAMRPELAPPILIHASPGAHAFESEQRPSG